MIYWPVFILGLLTIVVSVGVALNARADAEIGMALQGIDPGEVTEAGKEPAARRIRIVSLLISLFGVGLMVLSVL